MSEETRLRELICDLAKSFFDRGLTSGSSGNITARLSDGRLLVTPTGSTFRQLDPARLSLMDGGTLVAGDPPTKEMPLHTAFYDTRPDTGAVVHLHSSYSVALSLLPDQDDTMFLPPLTAYGVMRLGRVKLLPYIRPGDEAMGDAVRDLKGRYSAVMLAHHGPVVADKDLTSACYAAEELEETAKLALLTKGLSPKTLDAAQIQGLVDRFGVTWD